MSDDLVIFASSANGLQQLLNVCSTFAETHSVVFNNISLEFKQQVDLHLKMLKFSKY